MRCYSVSEESEKSNNIKNILVMFSGGLDSTTALYKLLKETNNNIYVHHIILKDTSNRWKYELDTSRDIVKYLKNIRPFDYSESTVDVQLNSEDPKGGSRHDDNSTVLFIANQISTVESYKKIDYIVISELECEQDKSTKDYATDMIDVMHKRKWSVKKPKMYDPLKEFNNNKCTINKDIINKIKNYVLSNLITQETPLNLITNELFINIICTKRKMYQYLPQDLQNKIVYCRTPNNNNKCNNCFNCLLYENIV